MGGGGRALAPGPPLRRRAHGDALALARLARTPLAEAALCSRSSSSAHRGAADAVPRDRRRALHRGASAWPRLPPGPPAGPQAALAGLLALALLARGVVTAPGEPTSPASRPGRSPRCRRARTACPAATGVASSSGMRRGRRSSSTGVSVPYLGATLGSTGRSSRSPWLARGGRAGASAGSWCGRRIRWSSGPRPGLDGPLPAQDYPHRRPEPLRALLHTSLIKDQASPRPTPAPPWISPRGSTRLETEKRAAVA